MSIFPLFFNFYFLAVPCGMWDSSSPSGIKPEPHMLDAWSPKHWITREVPQRPYSLIVQIIFMTQKFNMVKRERGVCTYRYVFNISIN